MDYTCRIDGLQLCCTITPDRDLTGAVFCCSGMAPLTALAGGDRVTGLGSYVEVALPPLRAGKAHDLTLEYMGGFRPANRAWMPMRPTLRVAGEDILLPPTEAGPRAQALPPADPFDGLPIVPQPVHWAPAGGNFDCPGVRADDAAIRAVADLATRRGLRFSGPTPLRLRTDDGLDTGAYRLTMVPEAITLTAGDYTGRVAGAVTLLQLLQAGPLPCGTVTDAPRFDWRGQHLDCARHFFQPETILDLLDLMALLKLNRFHWHFADDEAFRLELDSLPALWRGTADRGAGQLLPALFGEGLGAGGTYDKAFARQVIARAADLAIEVLPEIESPAHMLAVTRSYPETRDPGDNGAEMSVQGYHDNAVNPAMPRTWEVLEAMVTEVGALFPFGHLHLGCDELAEGTWMGSPLARALMADERLETTDDLQGWMMERLAGIVAANGQRPCAWEEAARGSNGGIGHDAILFSWTGQGPGLEAAAAGYDVVMTPAQHVYLDMARTGDADDWGAAWAAVVGLEDTTNWTPVPDPALADRIIGVQGAFWGEFTTQDDQLWPMLLPRMLGVAMQGWQKARPKRGAATALAHDLRWLMEAYDVEV